MGNDRRQPEDTRLVIRAIGRGAASAVVLQGKILKKLYSGTLGAMWRGFRRASTLGKVFILVGLLGCIAAAGLAIHFAIDVSFVHKEYILVTAARANVRESTSNRSEVVARVKRGDELFQKGESEGFWFVEARRFEKPGWISKRVSRLEKKLLFSLDYEMKGYGLAFLVSLFLLVVGFASKRTSRSVLPPFPPS